MLEKAFETVTNMDSLVSTDKANCLKDKLIQKKFAYLSSAPRQVRKFLTSISGLHYFPISPEDFTDEELHDIMILASHTTLYICGLDQFPYTRLWKISQAFFDAEFFLPRWGGIMDMLNITSTNIFNNNYLLNREMPLVDAMFIKKFVAPCNAIRFPLSSFIFLSLFEMTPENFKFSVVKTQIKAEFFLVWHHLFGRQYRKLCCPYYDYDIKQPSWEEITASLT